MIQRVVGEGWRIASGQSSILVLNPRFTSSMTIPSGRAAAPCCGCGGPGASAGSEPQNSLARHTVFLSPEPRGNGAQTE
jgi:hypothetical protein